MGHKNTDKAKLLQDLSIVRQFKVLYRKRKRALRRNMKETRDNIQTDSKNSIYKVTTVHVLSYIPPPHLAIQLMCREPDYIDAATHGTMCFKSYPSLLANSPSLLRALWNPRHASLISVYKSQIASTHSIGSRSVERAVPKVVTAHTFFTRPVNTSSVKHQHTVILTSGLRGDSLTSLSLTHQSLLSLTCCLTDFMHA